MPKNSPNDRPLSSTDRLLFGLESDDDDRWIEHLRAAQKPVDLGYVGPYRLLEEVSRGGQGVVYRARRDDLKRDVALKCPVAGVLSSRAALARFEREVEAVTALRHPGIVTLYGVEKTGGIPLLAMEWVDGIPVSQWATNRRRDETLCLFLQVCDAVSHAHRNGVLHRDLKPSNILVDSAGRPRVLDFGLARLIDPERDEPRQTQGSMFVGTPEYASPEQISRGAANTDVRSDVYSLGVVLYEMLTGQRPYRPEQGLREFLHAVERENLIRPSSIRGELNRELDAILLTALRAEPDDRYASVDALAADVRRLLAGRPVEAHPDTLLYRLRKFAGRNRLLCALAGALMLSLVLFAVVAMLQARTVAQERDAALAARAAESQARQNAEAEKETTDAVLNFILDDLLKKARPSVRDEPLTVAEVFRAAAARVGEAFANRPAVEVRVRQTLGQVFLEIGDRTEAELHFRKALAVLAREGQSDTGNVAVLSLQLGDLLIGTEAQDEAEALLTRAVELLSGKPARYDAQRMSAYLALARLYLFSGRRDEAAAAARMARPLVESLPESAGDGRFDMRARLAQTLAAAGDEDTAISSFEEILQELEGTGRDHALQSVVAHDLAILHMNRGEKERAEELWRRCLDLQRALYGDNDDRVVNTLAELAISISGLGRPDEAEEAARLALDTVERLPDASTDFRAQAHATLAAVLSNDRHDYAAAEPHYLKAAELLTTVLGADHSRVQLLLKQAQICRERIRDP